MAAHLPRAVHLLGDLILHPLYREDDLERERQVILEEIYSQDDSPEDLVQVEFARHFWKGCSFGRPILGELETVASFSRADLLSFRQATYRPEQLVVAAAGRLRHQELVDFVAALFDGFANGSPPRPQEPVATHPGAFLFPRELEQVHVCLGAPGLSAGHRQRYGATVLQLLLGGNMSSRLFQVVREQLGLAYNIYSFMSFFSGHGLLGISAGVSPKHLSPLLDAVNRELSQLKREPVSEAELQAAQDYLKASLYLHAEDCDQRMMRLAKNEIHFGHYIPLEDIVAGLLRVTIPELQTLAQDFFQSDKWGLALLGPLNSGDLDKNTLSF
jgi:predicted Zn-dependent peptidase